MALVELSVNTVQPHKHCPFSPTVSVVDTGMAYKYAPPPSSTLPPLSKPKALSISTSLAQPSIPSHPHPPIPPLSIPHRSDPQSYGHDHARTQHQQHHPRPFSPAPPPLSMSLSLSQSQSSQPPKPAPGPSRPSLSLQLAFQPSSSSHPHTPFSHPSPLSISTSSSASTSRVASPAPMSSLSAISTSTSSSMSYYGCTSPLSPSSDYLTPTSASTSYYTPTSAFPSSSSHSRTKSAQLFSPSSANSLGPVPAALTTRWELSPYGNVSEIIPGLLISDLSIAEDEESLEELGVTHVLSVMPGKVNVPRECRRHKRRTIEHLQVAIYDNPFEELVAHLPKTTDWICEALHPASSRSHSHQRHSSSSSTTNTPTPSRPSSRAQHHPSPSHSHLHSQSLHLHPSHFSPPPSHPHPQTQTTQNKVLVHCALGRSRSVSVVCAYLIHTHGYSPDEALALVKRTRSVAQPNSGFVGQLGEWARGLGRS